MQLSSETSDRLRAWLGCETWDTPYALDRDRFYEFVDSYQRGGCPDCAKGTDLGED